MTWPLNLRARFWLGIPQRVAAMAAFYWRYWTDGYWGQWRDLPARGALSPAAMSMTLASVVATPIGTLWAQRTE